MNEAGRNGVRRKRRASAYACLGFLSACGGTKAPPDSGLAAGPVPVSLPALDATQVRTLTHITGYVTIDAHGAMRWGKPVAGTAPYDGALLAHGESAFDRVLDDGTQAFQPDNFVHYDVDSFGDATTESSTEAVVLADVAAPAWMTVRRGIEAFGNHKVALGASAGNQAVAYCFEGCGGQDPSTGIDLTLHVDQVASLAGQHPHAVMLEYTDATTTGELVTALGALSQAGVAQVRLHRMMGWGDIPPSEIVSVKGPVSDDDVISSGPPAMVKLGDPVTEGYVAAAGVGPALYGDIPRFRYCFEKRGLPQLHGKVELSFDIDENDAVANVQATGLDPHIASCVAGAVFDLDIDAHSIRGTGHATTAIWFNEDDTPVAMATNADADAPGFWCWTASGNVGMCAPQQDQCDAARAGFNQTSGGLGGASDASACALQSSAWTSDGVAMFPSKKTCGEHCRRVR